MSPVSPGMLEPPVCTRGEVGTQPGWQGGAGTTPNRECGPVGDPSPRGAVRVSRSVPRLRSPRWGDTGKVAVATLCKQ